MRISRWRWLVATVALTAIVAAGCGDEGGGTSDASGGSPTTTTSGPPQADPNAKPLVISVTTEPSTLDAQAVNDRSSRVFTSNIFEPLLTRDSKAQIVPKLALSYTVINDTTWRFTLRQGVKFHNGAPFNADTAAFSINRMLDKNYTTQRTSYLENIVKATKVDEYTLDIESKGVNAVLPIQVTQLPMIDPSSVADIASKPVGTGPYEFVRWDRGKEIVAKRFEGYWGDKPTTAEFHVRIIPDNQTALSALQTGEVDLVLDVLPEQKKLAPKTLSVAAAEFSYIAFNTYKAELKDPRVRKALNMAIDKKTLAETVYSGEAKPNEAQHLTPESLGFNPNVHMIPYDPEGAKKLLAEAGYPNGFSLVLSAPIGRYLKGEETAQYVAAQLDKIGVKTTVNLIEWNKYRDDARIKGDQPGAMDLKYGWNSNEFLEGSRIVAHITCKGSSSKYCNPQVDTLMADAAKTMDPTARAAKYQAVWKILNDDPYSIYLLQQNLVFGTTKRLVWQPRLDDEYFVSEMILVKA